MSKVGTGFNHDRTVRRPGDDETEAVGLSAEVRAVAQDNRIRKHPQCCRPTTKCRSPSHGPGKVVDGATVRQPIAPATSWCIALEIDARQDGAQPERLLPDVGDGARDRDTRQACPSGERPTLNAGNTVGNRDTR